MKIFRGKVISTNMKDTATVVIERIVVDPLYKKRLKRRKKYHVHDTLGAKVGQSVSFVGSRSFSKTKKWRLIKIEERDKTGVMPNARKKNL